MIGDKYVRKTRKLEQYILKVKSITRPRGKDIPPWVLLLVLSLQHDWAVIWLEWTEHCVRHEHYILPPLTTQSWWHKGSFVLFIFVKLKRDIEKTWNLWQLKYSKIMVILRGKIFYFYISHFLFPLSVIWTK